jgi:hypothetical protein
MKRTSLAIAAVAFMLIAGDASAQTTGVGVSRIEIAPEQRTRIKEYVVERKVSPVTVRERITVGSALPADVELQTVPADWGPSVSRYRYVYHDNQVVLVEPSSRQVIEIID